MSNLRHCVHDLKTPLVSLQWHTQCLIRELHARGMGPRPIARELTSRGIPPKGGGPRWSHNTIVRILEASLLLRDAVKITTSKIEFTSTGATITALASDYAGAAGANPTITCFDELWGYADPSPERARELIELIHHDPAAQRDRVALKAAARAPARQRDALRVGVCGQFAHLRRRLRPDHGIRSMRRMR